MKGRILVTLLVALTATACGPGGPPGGGPQAGPPGPPGSVPVSEKEWTITFPTTAIKAGRLTFRVKNEGAIEHNFVIEAVRLQIDAIQPGQTKEASADLRAGTYEVVCNIPGHKEAGMKATLTIAQ
ncbi:MAG TPA: cupredoxin domain-containing protein [bacterium]|nr:cupredoxin domain-containing protein [bacterium]